MRRAAQCFTGVVILLALVDRALCAEREWVVCPAIDQDNRGRHEGPGGPGGTIDLIVLGTVHANSSVKAPTRGEVCDVQIEKILYGHIGEKTLQFYARYRPPTDVPIVIALTRDGGRSSAQYGAKYFLDGGEEWSQRALAEARLDYNVLSATAIFVGHRSVDEPTLVDVDRVLYGAELAPGARVLVEAIGYPQQEPLIYLAEEIETFPSDKPNRCRLKCGLSTAWEASVKESLARRNAYPVVEKTEDGQTIRQREVVFRGTPDEAIRLLGSASEAAATLGARKLLQLKPESVKLVAAAIEEKLFVQQSDDESTFRRQTSLAKLLGMLEDHRVAGDAGRLFRKMLDRIAGDDPPPAPAKPKPPDRLFDRRRENDTSANHSLVWLLAALDEGQVLDQLADRLLTLRTKLAGPWKDELELALEVSHVEDNLEMRAAMARMQGVMPVRSSAGLWHDGPYKIAFSPDGKYFTTVGYGKGKVWNTADWSQAGEFNQDDSVSRVLFSQDGRLIYIAGGGAGLQYHHRVDWRTGRIDRAFQGHNKGIAELDISRDEKVMVTSSFYENVLNIWNLPEGKIVRSYRAPLFATDFALRPDGKLLLRQERGSHWVAESLADGKSWPVPFQAKYALFSPDSATLYTVSRPDGRYDAFGELDAPTVRVEARKPNDNFDVLRQTDPMQLHHVIISPKGNRLAGLALKRGRAYGANEEREFLLRIFTLPDLKLSAELPLPVLKDPIDAIAFSPDGNVVAAGINYRPPLLLKAQTGERIRAGVGHEDRITDIAFQPDGTLKSTGKEGVIWHWDTRGMKVLRREKDTPPGDREPRMPDDPGELTEDKKSYFRINVHPYTGDVRVVVTDAATKEKHELGPFKSRQFGYASGQLVPGGKYFSIGTEIYDRESLRLVSEKRLSGVDVLGMSWSPDGTRYALITGGRIFLDEHLRKWDPGTQSIVRIHNTETGKTLWAMRPSTRWIKKVALDAKNTEVAVLNDDDTIEVWPLPREVAATNPAPKPR